MVDAHPRRTWTLRQGLALAAGSAAYVLILVVGVPVGMLTLRMVWYMSTHEAELPSQRAFDAEEWRRARTERSSACAAMVEDLRTSHLAPGTEVEEVLRLLGPPENGDGRALTLLYDLHQPGVFMEQFYLFVSVDPAGRVDSTWVRAWD